MKNLVVRELLNKLTIWGPKWIMRDRVVKRKNKEIENIEMEEPVIIRNFPKRKIIYDLPAKLRAKGIDRFPVITQFSGYEYVKFEFRNVPPENEYAACHSEYLIIECSYCRGENQKRDYCSHCGAKLW